MCRKKRRTVLRSSFRRRALVSSCCNPNASASSAATDSTDSREMAACVPVVPARMMPFNCPFQAMGAHNTRRSPRSSPRMGFGGEASRSCSTVFPRRSCSSGSGGSMESRLHSGGVSVLPRSQTIPRNPAANSFCRSAFESISSHTPMRHEGPRQASSPKASCSNSLREAPSSAARATPRPPESFCVFFLHSFMRWP